MSTSLPWLDAAVAERVGQRAVRPGPRATPEQIADLVTDLRQAAHRAPALVAAASGLPVPSGPGADHVLVVDRRGWVSANCLTIKDLMSTIGAPAEPSSLGRRIAGRALGAQLGGLLGLLGSRVLGQYDPFGRRADGQPARRLVLVAPTIMDVERQLDLVPRDFRTWVALHEQTHRVQFHAAPWLVDHLLGLVAAFLASEDQAGEGLGELLQRAGGAWDRSGEVTASSSAMLDLVVAPQAKQELSRVTAVMSLLEGHADVLMDLAGAPVIDSLAAIRQRFEARRARGGVSGMIARLTAMDAKLAQYRQGAAFCRRVIDQTSMTRLNLVFTAPELLPSSEEIDHPDLWLARTELIAPPSVDGR